MLKRLTMFSCVILLVNAAYMSGAFTIPKNFPILTQIDLMKAVNKPGILVYRFKIKTNSTSSFIPLKGLEPIARMAEKRKFDLSMRIELSQNNSNITMELEKCGFKSTPITTIIKKEILIYPPSFFTTLSNFGISGCKTVVTPMQLIIKGPVGTSGTVSINVLEYPGSAKVLVEDLVIYYLYPILFAITFVLSGCAFSSMFCCSKRSCFARCQRHQTWTEFAQSRIVYTHEGTPV